MSARVRGGLACAGIAGRAEGGAPGGAPGGGPGGAPGGAPRLLCEEVVVRESFANAWVAADAMVWC